MHTVAVMQTKEHLHRVAAECALDLAADGVVYAEVRYAPEQHLERGLTLDEVVVAVQEGFAAGSAQAADAGHPDPDRHPGHGDAARGPQPRDRRARGAAPRPGRRRVRHRRRRGRASRRPGTSTPSTTCTGRTSTSRSTPARRSGCRRSGRPSRSAAPTGSGTASGSSTTSRCSAGRPVRAARGAARPDRRLGAGQPDPARAVPDVEPADRRGGEHRRAPDHAAQGPALPGHR